MVVQTGSFYAFVPRQVPGLAFWKNKDNKVQKKFEGFSNARCSIDEQNSPRYNVSRRASLLGGGSSETHSYVFPGGGAIARQGTREVAGELVHVQPYVYATDTAVAVLYGYLSLDSSQDGSGSGSYGGGSSPGMLEFDNLYSDQGTLAAEIILQQYLHTRSNDLLIMLSELQGQFAFVVYDSQKKQVFAARDPSGKEPLYYYFDEDDNVSFTNQPFNVPGEDAETAQDWLELPPGHFIAGKHPRLQQFALTPDELYVREYMESLEDNSPSHLSSRDRFGFTAGSLGFGLETRGGPLCT